MSNNKDLSSPLSSSPLFPPTWTTSPNSGSSERSRGLSHSRVRSRCCLHHSGPDKIIVLTIYIIFTIIIIILLMITVIIISLIAMIFTMMKNAVNGHWSGSMRGFLQVRLWRLDGLDHQHHHHCHQHHYHHHCCQKKVSLHNLLLIPYRTNFDQCPVGTWKKTLPYFERRTRTWFPTACPSGGRSMSSGTKSTMPWKVK